MRLRAGEGMPLGVHGRLWKVIMVVDVHSRDEHRQQDGGDDDADVDPIAHRGVSLSSVATAAATLTRCLLCERAVSAVLWRLISATAMPA